MSNNGTNEKSNLQTICVGCHMDKTYNEQENGQFVKFSDTESNFNNQIQEIMSSNLSSSLQCLHLLNACIRHTWKKLSILLEEIIYTINIRRRI